MKQRLSKIGVLVLVVAISLTLFAFDSYSVQASGYNPNNVISDWSFEDETVLSQTSIQSFLVGKGSYLANYKQGGKLASRIIYEAARNYNLSPKVILVMMQKEQSLVTSSGPSSRALDWAMGYGNIDAVPEYKGFTNQINWAARSIGKGGYYDSGRGHYNYDVGRTTRTEDGVNVTPQNYSTAKLFIYNPVAGYNPDNESLSYYGGNYLFWTLWNSWFSNAGMGRTILGAVGSASYPNGSPEARMMSYKGYVRTKFYPFNSDFGGGSFISAGDVNKDGKDEIITSKAYGSRPLIRTYNADGIMLSSYRPFEEGFKGGTDSTPCDINGDGKDELCAVRFSNGRAQVNIFNYGSGTPLYRWQASGITERKGGNITAGDVNGDGKDEIIVGYNSSPPTIKIFKPDGKRIKTIMAFDPVFAGGVDVAACDVDNDGRAEIVAAKGPTSKPEVAIFEANGKRISKFYADDHEYRGGLRVACGDVLGSGTPEIVTSRWSLTSANTKVFNNRGRYIKGFTMFSSGFRGGADVGIGNF